MSGAPTTAGPGRRWLLLGAVAVVLVLAIVAVSVALSRDEPQSSGSDPSQQPPQPVTPGSTSDPSPVRARVTLSALPAVAQPGPTPAAAAEASPVVTALADPADPGATIVLERAAGDGWAEAARGGQDSAGRVTFTDVPPAPRYRAVVLGPGGNRSRPGPVLDASTWQLGFDDEFAGSSLDSSRWDYRALGVYNPEGARECSVSDESAVAVGGGALDLQVRPDPQRAGETCATAQYGTHDYYLNGHISTEGVFGFRYGVAAARVKFQQGRGQHGAFWLQRSGSIPVVPGDPERSGAEIDVAEFFGEGYQQGGLASFVYYLDDSGEDVKVGGLQPAATDELPAGDAWWSQYHVVSVEWTPERYVFRVDGREFYRTSEGVSGVEQFLVLSLLSSDWELDRIDQASLPSSMSVDWVRVWQRHGGVNLAGRRPSGRGPGSAAPTSSIHGWTVRRQSSRGAELRSTKASPDFSTWCLRSLIGCAPCTGRSGSR